MAGQTEATGIGTNVGGSSDHPIIPRAAYHQLFDSEARPIAVVDLGLQLVDANQSLEEEIGLARSELLGASVADLWAIDVHDLAVELDQRLVEVGVIETAAGPAPQAPSVPTATLFFTPLDHLGQLVGYTMTFVSEEARLNRRHLSLDAEGFDLSFDQVAVGMLLSGMDGYVLKCNPAMVRLFDRSIDEIAETDLISMIHPDDRTNVISQALRLMTGEIDSYSQETRLLAGDGTPVWVHETATCIRDADGNLLHFMTQFVDIGDRKRAEEALLKSQSTIKFLFNGIPVPLLQLDDALRISEGNASLAALLGRDPIGLSIADVVHAEDMIKLGEAGATLAPDTDWIIDIRVRRHDGSERLVRSHGRIQVDDDGRFQSATASWHDITDAKEQEDRLRLQASTDSLTGLPNRAAFLERLTEATAAARTPAEVGVLFIDLDKFKPVNDRYGHEAGDQLLCQVARRLRSCVRSTDLVARLGGDEFVVLLDLTLPGSEGRVIGQRIVERLAHPFTTSHGTFAIGVSVGLAHGNPDSHPRELIHRADLAAYQAKAGGGSRLAIAHP